MNGGGDLIISYFANILSKIYSTNLLNKFSQLSLLSELLNKFTKQNTLQICLLANLLSEFSHKFTPYPEIQQYKDIYRRTIEMPQRAHIFKVDCCLDVHNAHLKLLLPISG